MNALAPTEPACTDFSAQWCPRCGTCTGCDRELHQYSDLCPLHGNAMRHAQGPEVDEVTALLAKVAELELSLAEARAIIAGRPTPPTRAEEVLHRRRRGSWLVFTPTPSGWRETEFPDLVAKQWSDDPRVRYVALDAERRLTVWPTVTP